MTHLLTRGFILSVFPSLFQDRIKPGAHGVPLPVLRKTLCVLRRGADVDLSLLSEEPSSSENETDDASWHGVDETPEESKERALRFLTWVKKKYLFENIFRVACEIIPREL